MATANFKNGLAQWVQIDNQLREHREAIKQLNNDKQTIEAGLVRYIDRNGMAAQKFALRSGGSIRYRVSKTREPISRPYLTRCLTAYLQNAEEAERLVAAIYDSRGQRERPTLSRYVPRRPKSARR